MTDFDDALKVNDGQRGTTLGFGPVRTPRASDILASRIREWILKNEPEEGTPLPPERLLMEETGLGRSTIREALRILQTEGLVVSKVGPKGGYLVRRPDVQTVIDSMTVYLRGQRFRFRSLVETRGAIEPAAAALAAERATEEDLARLAELNRRLADPDIAGEEFSSVNLDWHQAVVRSAHNELMTAFMTAISSVMHTASESVNRNLAEELDRIRSEVVAAHQKIQDAIKARDADAAARRMRRHVDGYAKFIAEMPGDDELDRVGAS